MNNSLRSWLLASRPKTLAGAAVPVMVALSLVWQKYGGPHWLWSDSFHKHSGGWLCALLCLLFALVMQIDANFINDYFDFKHGNDDESRLGPKRACAMGWVTPKAMKRAIMLTTLFGCIIGFPLIFYGGWSMLMVGVFCVVFCFLYTTWLSYLGLGDLLVLVFFGIVPVCCTYYLQTGEVVLPVFLASIGCGVAIDTLLLVNNFRDIDNDRRAGKRTIVVMMGKRGGLLLYFWCGLLAAFLAGLVLVMLSRGMMSSAINISKLECWRVGCCLVAVGFYVFLHLKTYQKMKRIDHGRELNGVLGETARNIFLYGVLTSLSFIFLS